MIVRDLCRWPSEDVHKALAACSQTVLRRGNVEPGFTIESRFFHEAVAELE